MGWILWAILFILALLSFLTGGIGFSFWGFGALLSALFAGLGFWVLCLLETIFILYCLDNSRDDGEDRFFVGWSTSTLFFVLLILQFSTSWKPFTFAWNHPFITMLGAAGYVIFGIVYSFVKWRLFTGKHNRRVEKIRFEFLKSQKIEGKIVPREKLLEWEEYFNRNRGYSRKGNHLSGELSTVKIQASKYKSMLIGWTALWPISFVWTLINDPFVRFFNWLYEVFQGWYQKISDQVFADVDKELKEIELLKEERRTSEAGTSGSMRREV